MRTETTTDTRVEIQSRTGGGAWRTTALGCAPDKRLTVEGATAWLRPHPRRHAFRIVEITETVVIHRFD